MEEKKFQAWLKENYGIQDYNAYAGTQCEEIAIQYAKHCLAAKEPTDLTKICNECTSPNCNCPYTLERPVEGGIIGTEISVSKPEPITAEDM